MIYEFTHLFNLKEQISEVELNEAGIILIDMNQYFLKYINPEKKEKLIKAHKEILTICAEKNYPVLNIEMPKYGKTITELTTLIKQTPRHETFYKLKESAFSNEKLCTQIKKWNMNFPILMGINTYCIKSTAIDALAKTYQPITAPELIATPENDHKAWKEHTLWLSNNIIYLNNYNQLINSLNTKS